MAARFLAAFDAVDLERHHLAVEDAQDRMQRPHPAQRPLPQRIDFGQGKLRTISGTTSATTSRRCAPRSLDQRHIEVALLVGADLRLVQRLEPGRFEEALHRRLGRADARALLLLAHVGRPRRQAIDHRRRAAAAWRSSAPCRTSVRRPSAYRQCRRSRSSAARVCMRAGISSENSSSRSSAMSAPTRIKHGHRQLRS